MFRTYYALRAGMAKSDGIDFAVIEVPDPPSRELEDVLVRDDVDISNIYLPNFLERRLEGAPIIGLCTEWKSTRAMGCSFGATESGARPTLRDDELQHIKAATLFTSPSLKRPTRSTP
jgi:hypothetical protein